MENISTAIVIFTYVKAVLFIVLTIAGVFLIKLIIDLSKLVINLDEVATILKVELEPLVKELKETLCRLNSLASATDTQVDNVKKIFSKALGLSGLLFGKVRSVSGSFFKGIATGIKMFSK